MGEFPSISLKLNFTPNTLGGYGLSDQRENSQKYASFQINSVSV